MSKGKTGTIVSKMDKNTQLKITEETIDSLNPKKMKPPSMEEMFSHLQQIKTDPNPTYLHSKDQKFSNCTMVNAKGILQALYYSRKKRKLTDQLKQNQNKSDTEPIIVMGIEVNDEASLEMAAQKYAYVNYKKARDAIRNIKLEDLIEKTNTLSPNSPLYFDLLKNYLIEHHGQFKSQLHSCDMKRCIRKF